MTTLFALLIGHGVGDFALQSGDMARGKNRHRTLENVPPGQALEVMWPYWLTSHALIHAGAVWIVTGHAGLAALEFLLHWIIDFAKCENWTGIHTDQALHVACKVAYVLVAL